MCPAVIRDLIYLDIGKATSLLSQIEGGLLKESTEKKESTKEKSGEAKVSLKIIDVSVGKDSSDQLAFERTKVLHHNLLETVEEWLFDRQFAIDINNVKIIDGGLMTTSNLRDLVENFSYIRVEGYVEIDDFTYLQNYTQNFTKLVEFINKCNKFSLEDNQEYKNIQQLIVDEKKGLKTIKDSKKRALADSKLMSLQQSLNQILIQMEQIKAPDNWLLQGISDWINQFNKGQIHLIVKPFDNSDIEIISNLKREYFIDTDINHLIFSYGTKPNVKLTVFGLITSIPPKNELSNEPTDDSPKQDADKGKQFEKSFRNVFKAMKEFETFSGFENYSSIKIYPIAVYRKITSCFEQDNQELETQMNLTTQSVS